MEAIRQLVVALSDGELHSGSELGIRLGLSRSGVWKLVRHGRETGLPIRSHRSQGYMLPAAFEPLDINRISSQIPADLVNAIQLDLTFELDSSNTALASCPLAPHLFRALFVERQTAGRGRRGRCWYSSIGSSLCFSVKTRFESFTALAGLSLAIGVSIVRALESIGVGELALKWPNDIMSRGQKAGGILIDVEGHLAGSVEAVIGIGLNLALSEQSSSVSQIDQPWSNIDCMRNLAMERNRLAGVLLVAVVECVLEFQRSGLEAFKRHWEARDFLLGRSVEVQQGERFESGTYCGVDNQGAAIVETNEALIRLFGGEITLRPRL